MKKVFLLIVISLLLTGGSVIMTFPVQALFFVLAIRFCKICKATKDCDNYENITFRKLTKGTLIILSGLFIAMLIPSFIRGVNIPFYAFAYLCVGINLFYLCCFYLLIFMKGKKISEDTLKFITTICVVFVSVSGLSLL